MRRVVFLPILAGVVLMGGFVLIPSSTTSQDATPSVAECPVTTPADHEALARDYYVAVDSGDDPALEALLADDYLHHWGIGRDTEGRDAFIAAVQDFRITFPDLTREVGVVFANDTMTAAQFTITATQSREWRGFPPADAPVSWTGIHLFRIDCGQIVEGWNESDHLGRLMQQGAIPAPEATPAA